MFTRNLDDFLFFIILVIFEIILIKANWKIRVIDKKIGGVEKNKFNKFFDDRDLTWLSLLISCIFHIGSGFGFYYFGIVRGLFFVTGFVVSNAIWDAWQADC